MRKKLLYPGFNATSALKNFVRGTAFSIVLLLSANFKAISQSELLRDLNASHERNHNEFSNLTHGGGNMYFIMNNALWKSTGTPNSTVGVKRFNSISNLTMVGSTLYFAADDGVSGVELWKSNGTTTGTVKVKDIYGGRSSSLPQNFTNVNGLLYFSATNGTNGRELWKSNGTAEGTVLVKDILKVSGGSNPGYLTPIGSTLYFVANDGTNGYEVWKTDGTAAGTVMVKDIRTGYKISSLPQYLININGVLYFGAIDNTAGRELWKSNGTAAGTVRIKDIRSGSASSGVENLIDVNGTLFFTADDGIHGDELWKSNGTAGGTVLVKDLNPGAAGSNNVDYETPHGMSNFKNINGILYFTASKQYQDYIYRSDGTPTGTFIVAPVSTASSAYYQFGIAYPDPEFTYMNGDVYFFNSRFTPDEEQPDGGQWYYLFKMAYNGTSPVPVKLFYREADGPGYTTGYRQELMTFNNLMFTFGKLTPTVGFGFVRSDGTEAGTYTIKDPYQPTLSSQPDGMVTAGNITYMVIDRIENPGYPARNDNELYRTDGTALGTYSLISGATNLTKVGNTVFFTYAASDGYYLRKANADGTNTIVVKSGITGYPENFTDVDGILYFSTDSRYVWRSDGTTTGTTMIGDLLGGITKIYSSAGRAFVMSDRSALQLWKAETTGLSLVKTIRSSGNTYVPYKYPSATIGNVFYFVANDGIHGNEIWRTDGTSAGTYMLFDLETNDRRDFLREYGIDQFSVLNNRLYFAASGLTNFGLFYTTGNSSFTKISSLSILDMVADQHKLYLWYTEEGRLFFRYSDGETMDGLVMYIYMDSFHFNLSVDHTFVDDVLYFGVSAARQLYRSDGTHCNTSPISTGTTTAYPIEPLGNSIVFFGYRSATGVEPNIFRNINTYDFVECQTTAAAAEPGSARHTVAVTPYPNPFTDEFTIRFDGKDGEIANVSIFSSTGFPMENLGRIQANTDYNNIGTTWPKGMYIVKVNSGGIVSTQIILKK